MRWLLTTLLILQCATCGQKGPLTLPESSVAGSGSAATDRTATLPRAL